jgi:hypothetical protein
MRIKLEARGLMAVVDPGDAEFQVHRMALDAICSAVPVEMITALATKVSALEVWESIKMMQVNNDRIRTVSAQKLRREYDELNFRSDEGVDDFSMRLSKIINQLTILGDLEPDDRVILKLLRIARPRYKQLVISIETLLDVSTLPLEEVTGRLRSAEEDGVAPPTAEGKLLLTEEEWLKRNKKASGDRSCGGSNGCRGGRSHGGRNRGRGRGHGGHGDGACSLGGRGGNSNNCHQCGKPGH